ncbi:MAG: potassium transporter TrkG [Butyricicoccus sp.]
MFIGGSPGSTAGGIKTVTAAVLVLTAISASAGAQRFRRSAGRLRRAS